MNEYAVVGQRAELLLQQLPRLDLVEQLEQQDAEDHLDGVVRQVVAVDHAADQVLADPVGGPVGVGELVRPQHRVVGPRRRAAFEAAEEHALPLGGEPPVGVVNRRSA